MKDKMYDLHKFIPCVEYSIRDIQTNKIVDRICIVDRFESYVKIVGRFNGWFYIIYDKNGYECISLPTWKYYCIRSYDILKLTQNQYLNIQYDYKNNNYCKSCLVIKGVWLYGS